MSYTILAIETGSSAGSVALQDSLGQCHLRVDDGGRQHSRSLLGMIDDVLHAAMLKPHALDCLAWNAGPGSFTGLRIGASVMQALAYACGLPVVSLSSLELHAFAVVRAARREDPAGYGLLAAIDAGMGSAYCARFSVADGGVARVSEDVLIPKQDLASLLIEAGTGNRLLCTGNAWHDIALPEGVQHADGYEMTADDVLALAATKPQSQRMTSPASCLPHYVHQGQQWQKRQFRSVSPR